MKMNEKILACRRRAGLSQEALAERLEVSRQAVSRWECGEATPEPAKILTLARTFGVTADWLLDDEQGELPEDAPLESTTVPQSLDDAPPAVEVPTQDEKPKKRPLTVGLICLGTVLVLYIALILSILTAMIGTRLFNIGFILLALLGGLTLLVIGIVGAVGKNTRK